jgi:hypothetical protein
MHLTNRVLATVLALALFLGGLLTVVEVVLVHLQRPAWLIPTGQWSSWLRAQTFGAGLVRAICIGLALLGLLLLVAALRRGKPGALLLPSRHDGVQVTASRRQVQQTLSTAARRVDGVDGARVKAGRRKARVKATTPLRDPGDLEQRVTAAVTERLGELELTDRVRPRVSLSSKGTR